MPTLTASEYRLLDELYFVTTYRELVEQLSMEESEVQTTLMGLLNKGFIMQMQYNDNMKDYLKLEQPDFLSIERSSFVASREGLKVHNSRS